MDAVAWALEDGPRSFGDVVDRVGGWDDPLGVQAALRAWRVLGVVRVVGDRRTARWEVIRG
jgi:hypothetical protein